MTSIFHQLYKSMEHSVHPQMSEFKHNDDLEEASYTTSAPRNLPSIHVIENVFLNAL